MKHRLEAYFEEPVVPTPEQLANPDFALNAGYLFANEFGITADPFTETAEYEAQMRVLNPRTPTDGGKTKLRSELQGSKRVWTVEQSAIIMYTAGRLGLLAPEYPIEDAEVDEVLVAEGTPEASLARAEDIVKAIRERRLRVHGGVRVAGTARDVPEKEVAAVPLLRLPGKNVKGFDVADAVADRLGAKYAHVLETGGADGGPLSVEAFHVEQVGKVDQRVVVAEFIDRLRADGTPIGSLALATTAIYVPFKTHKTLAVATPRDVVAIVQGVASPPDKIAARTLDTYFSEVIQTLEAAAQHRQVLLANPSDQAN